MKATSKNLATPPARTVLSVLAFGILLAATHEARAVALVVNGTFATNGGSGQLTVNTTLSNWTGGGVEGVFGSQTTPPVFVYTPGSTTLTGANGDAFMGNVKFYGTTAAPDSGVVIAADGDPDWHGSLSQTINGLSIGNTYRLTFNWAGAQQQGFSGATTEKWQVTLGSSTQSTSTVSTPSQNFAGWQSGSLDYTATATSELLQFLAVGAPTGDPPWLLLDNVQMTTVPEPGAVLMLGIGSALAIGWRRRRGATSPVSN